MKIFWTVIALFTFAAAAYLITGSASPARPEPPKVAPTGPKSDTSGTGNIALPAARDERSGADLKAAPATEAASERMEPAPAKADSARLDPLDSSSRVPDGKGAGGKGSADNGLVYDSEEQGYIEPRTADAEGAPAVASETTAAKSTEAAAGAYEVAPGEVVKNEDGTLLIDGRFTVKGDGTESSPYEIPWELITSAEETYEPRAAKTRIPQRVAMLDGKRIRITGYVAFPMYVQQPKELLAMLNQWDGCCIGVPPTPYDAIEVQLKATVDDQARLATSGSVEGRFQVKPYVVGDWLVGLYVMDESVMTPKEFGGFGS